MMKTFSYLNKHDEQFQCSSHHSLIFLTNFTLDIIAKKVHLRNIFKEMIHSGHVGLDAFLVEVLLIIVFATIICTMPQFIIHIAFALELLRYVTFRTHKQSLAEMLHFLVVDFLHLFHYIYFGFNGLISQFSFENMVVFFNP